MNKLESGRSGSLIRPILTGFWRFRPSVHVRSGVGHASHAKEHDAFSELIYEQQAHEAERELLSFISAIRESYGPEQATVSSKDWLDESDLMDSPPRSEIRDWHSVTVAAFARLARRLDAA